MKPKLKEFERCQKALAAFRKRNPEYVYNGKVERDSEMFKVARAYRICERIIEAYEKDFAVPYVVRDIKESAVRLSSRFKL